MHEDPKAVAELCLNAAHDGTMSFPEIVAKLIEAGFESYVVDFRRNCQVYYLPDGGALELPIQHPSALVSEVFDADAVGALVRWAQSNGPDYSYASFCQKMRAAGCAGYFVSFLGQRVVYYGRTGETHVEMFPN